LKDKTFARWQIFATVVVDDCAPGAKAVFSFTIPDHHSGKVCQYSICYLISLVLEYYQHRTDHASVLLKAFLLLSLPVIHFCTTCKKISNLYMGSQQLKQFFNRGKHRRLFQMT
jgi:hypothetical protein